MDETSPKARSKRARVLRAADVIPPFDEDIEPTDDGDALAARHALVSSKPDDIARRVTGGLAVAVNPTGGAIGSAEPRAGVVEIPSYDLAANILAEQRRFASRRRRAPNQPQEKPAISQVGRGSRVCTPPFPPQDLTELQQIVAAIVARDIERFCRRPNRSLTA